MNTQIVASECCAGRFPQNTRSGFVYCLERSFDGIEFDVHLSADGQVVVHHDYRLNPRIARDGSGSWLSPPCAAIRALTLSELKHFDVGRYRPGSNELEAYPDYQPQDGATIPSLHELLDAYDERGGASTLWIELKSSPYQRDISCDPNELVRAVIAAVTAHGVEGRTVLLAFEWDVLRFARELCPDVAADYLTLNPAHIVALNRRLGPIDPYRLFGAFDPRRYGNDIPAAIAAAGGDWWGPHVADVTAADVAHAQELGVRVNLWGVGSSAAAISDALVLRADAITLSDPDLLRTQIRTTR
jgi:glycerophosphoryl diester phosphodiesterase